VSVVCSSLLLRSRIPGVGFRERMEGTEEVEGLERVEEVV
jgi:hypothetical protein